MDSKELNRRIFNSKRHGFLWNVLTMRRLENFQKSKEAFFRKKGATNLYQLLRLIKVREEMIPPTMLGFHTLGRERVHLENLFDTDFQVRAQLPLEIDHIKRELMALMEQSLPKNFREWEERRVEIEQAKTNLQEGQAKLATLPQRNSVPASLWTYPDMGELQRQKLIEPIKNDATGRYLFSKRGQRLFEDAVATSKIVSAEDDVEQACVASWGRLRGMLKGDLPGSSLLISLLRAGRSKEKTNE